MYQKQKQIKGSVYLEEGERSPLLAVGQLNSGYLAEISLTTVLLVHSGQRLNTPNNYFIFSRKCRH